MKTANRSRLADTIANPASEADKFDEGWEEALTRELEEASSPVAETRESNAFASEDTNAATGVTEEAPLTNGTVPPLADEGS